MDIERRKRVNQLADLLWDEAGETWKPEDQWRSSLEEPCGGDESLITDVVEFVRGCKESADCDVRITIELNTSASQ